MNRFRSGARARVRITTVAAAFAMALVLAACGGDQDAPVDAGASPDASADGEMADGDGAAGSCLAGDQDCMDADLPGDQAGAPELDDGSELDEAAVLRDAESLLGQTEEEVLELWGDVRVGRQGDEEFMLTQDYVPGRKTIATEDDGTGTFRVVEVVVELTDGSVTLPEGT